MYITYLVSLFHPGYGLNKKAKLTIMEQKCYLFKYNATFQF